jgi:glucosamine-6-phosphate deaminase
MEIVIAKNYTELSQKAAMIFLNTLALNESSVFGLATGSTPLGMYEELAKNTKEYSYNWSKVKTFNLDEYLSLDKNHSQSYRYAMQKNFFNHVNIKAKNIHVPEGRSNDTEAFCKKYEQMVVRSDIDIQLLGLGVNGHIAFNEPGSKADSKTRVIRLSRSTINANSRFFKNISEVPTSAITMGIGTILKAKRIILLASGKKKARAVRDMIEGRVSPKCPASLLREHKNVTVIVDEEAASLLREKYPVKKDGWCSLRILNERVVPRNVRILVISPHHDDSGVSAGATIRSLSKHNTVQTLVMTAGYHSEIANATNKQKIKIRNGEALKESKILGSKLILSQFKFYDHDKKFWRGDLRKFHEIFRKVRPDIILLPHQYDEHPSHRLSTELALDYIKEKKVSGIELWYYEGLWSQHILNKIDIVFGFGVELLQIKNRALKAHRSQTKRLPISEASTALSRFRAKTLPEQRMVRFGGNPPVISDFAEVYHMEQV